MKGMGNGTGTGMNNGYWGVKDFMPYAGKHGFIYALEKNCLKFTERVSGGIEKVLLNTGSHCHDK